MPVAPTPVRVFDPEPITFRPKGPPRPLRRALNAFYDVFLVVLIAAMLADGSPGPLLIVAAVLLAVSLVIRGAAWIAYRRDPSSHRFDPRPEIVLSSSLVGRIRELQRQDRRPEAFKLLQGETDLNFGDTVRALKLISDSAERGGPA